MQENTNTNTNTINYIKNKHSNNSTIKDSINDDFNEILELSKTEYEISENIIKEFHGLAREYIRVKKKNKFIRMNE